MLGGFGLIGPIPAFPKGRGLFLFNEGVAIMLGGFGLIGPIPAFPKGRGLFLF